MRRAVALSVLAALVVGLAICAVGPRQAAAEGATKGKLRHVVLFKFKDGTSDEDVKKVEDAFRELPKKISTIRDFEWGTNNSPEGLNQGFTHCFLLTFDDAKGREVYLPHPAHKAFGKVLRPHLDKVLVVDFVGEE